MALFHAEGDAPIGPLLADWQPARDLALKLSETTGLTLHELTELQQGDKELGGAAVQLLLTGSRGLAVSALWLSTHEKQKKHEWNELDIAVDTTLDAGALGARMTGGGFGGSAIALVATDAVASVGERVQAAFAARGLTEPGLFTAVPSPGGPVSQRRVLPGRSGTPERHAAV